MVSTRPRRGRAAAGRGREAIRGNLPAELSSFVGRRRELDEVRRLLRSFRSVTLIGAGGVGKTRLARRAAAQLRHGFRDGVWFADLSAVGDPELLTHRSDDQDLLVHLVGGPWGLPQPSSRPPVEALAAYLSRRRLLLVLDNCEHLLPACADLVATLLGSCPGLRVLATSREPLAVYGEAVLTVPPLPVPTASGAAPPQDLRRCESVALFVGRARDAVPGFCLSDDNREVVADICRRLEGLPLAIELAAAWLRVLSPEQILQRLTDRFALFQPDGEARPERHQTLWACVDWSYQLCAPQERLLWARLSVCAGGFELDAVESICADERLPAADLLDLVAGLVEKSIITRSDRGATARYRMLEIIREYGNERLIGSGDRAALRRRHRDWYEQLVRQARVEWLGDRQAYWRARLGREHPNLHAAVEYSLADPGQAEGGLRLAVRLPRLYWWAQMAAWMAEQEADEPRER